MAQKSEDEGLTQAPWSSGRDSTPSSESNSASAFAALRGFRPVLICMTGPRKSARFKIEKNEVVLGRSPSCDFVVDESAASRRHARILYENWDRPMEKPVCRIEDLESRVGTELNGKTITGVVTLRERDRIRIGRTLMGYFVRDAAELLHDEALYAHAMKDPLTGLDNRQQMTAHLKRLLDRARRQRGSVALLIADVDHFKNVNDTLGHQAGDEALRHIATMMQFCIREKGAIARWGGEEFALAIADVEPDQVHAIAERIRLSVENNPFKREGSDVVLTVSLGIGLFREEDSIESLFQRADQGLYSAKQTGRNRVVLVP